MSQITNAPVVNLSFRPDQFNLLLLGYCEINSGPSDRKKRGVIIDRNLIKTD